MKLLPHADGSFVSHLREPVGLDGRNGSHVHNEDAEECTENEQGVAEENPVVHQNIGILHLARVGGHAGGHRQPEVYPSTCCRVMGGVARRVRLEDGVTFNSF